MSTDVSALYCSDCGHPYSYHVDKRGCTMPLSRHGLPVSSLEATVRTCGCKTVPPAESEDSLPDAFVHRHFDGTITTWEISVHRMPDPDSGVDACNMVDRLDGECIPVWYSIVPVPLEHSVRESAELRAARELLERAQKLESEATRQIKEAQDRLRILLSEAEAQRSQ